MTWTEVADAAAAISLLLGAGLSLIAALGMVGFPDLLSRVHAASKPQVLGLLLVLLGVALRLRDITSIGLLLLVALFQLATAPIASHMVCRSSFRAGQVQADLLIVDELSDVLESQDRLEDQRGAP